MMYHADNIQQILWLCPKCGAEAFVYDHFKSFTCASCGFTLYHNAAAAVMGVLTLEDRILFARRAHDPAVGKLDLPGGFVDPGETAEAALRREILEEMGVTLGALRYLGSAPNRYAFGGMVYPTCDLVFHAVLQEMPTVLDKSEVTEVLLLRPDAVDTDTLAFSSNRAALQLYASHCSC